MQIRALTLWLRDILFSVLHHDMPKTLNDIIPPSRRPSVFSGGGSVPLPSELSRGGRRFPWGTAFIALAIVLLSTGALYAFSGAQVEVDPRTDVAYVSGEFTATPSAGDLPYEIVSVEKTGSQMVTAERTESVTLPAQGTLIVSNEQTVSQKLIKNTRFETPGRLVFRIRESVTVPAAKNGVAGTVSAVVYADEAGEKYNIPASSFTLPGLAGSKQFSLVYAKSSQPMTGGFSGTRGVVSKSTADATHAALKSALTSELASALTVAIPAGYTNIKGSSFAVYEELSDAAGATGSVELREKGVMMAAIFPTEALAKTIAYKMVGVYSGQPVTLISDDSLTLTSMSGKAPVQNDSFSFSLSGDASIVWKIDESKIAGAVAGKSLEAAQVVLSGFPEVDRALLVLRPFWKSTFPDDPASITVITHDPSIGGGN